jgi:hypothetical protein
VRGIAALFAALTGGGYVLLVRGVLWRLGQWWGDRVAESWESVVAKSLADIGTEAERRAAPS